MSKLLCAGQGSIKTSSPYGSGSRAATHIRRIESLFSPSQSHLAIRGSGPGHLALRDTPLEPILVDGGVDGVGELIEDFVQRLWLSFGERLQDMAIFEDPVQVEA